MAAAASFAASGRAADAGAEAEGKLRGAMSCERSSEPGRVKCALEARVDGGRTIAWADALILQLPDFASALKGRIGPSDTTSREASTVKWALGLVAKRAGQGEARARVRAVVCEPAAGAEAAARCTPESVEVRAMLDVGGS